jgi:hypothetical protein
MHASTRMVQVCWLTQMKPGSFPPAEAERTGLLHPAPINSAPMHPQATVPLLNNAKESSTAQEMEEQIGGWCHSNRSGIYAHCGNQLRAQGLCNATTIAPLHVSAPKAACCTHLAQHVQHTTATLVATHETSATPALVGRTQQVECAC